MTVTGSQTVVGTSNNVPSAAKIVNADGEDVTASYNITYANGTLEVTQKTLTITADSDEKVYDGTPAQKAGLIEGDIIVSADGHLSTDEKLDAFVQRIRGEEGTEVELLITRNGEEKTFTCKRASNVWKKQAKSYYSFT